MKNSKESIILEIRSAEGGDDSKLLISNQFDIYSKSAKLNNFDFEISENRPGFISV